MAASNRRLLSETVIAQVRRKVLTPVTALCSAVLILLCLCQDSSIHTWLPQITHISATLGMKVLFARVFSAAVAVCALLCRPATKMSWGNDGAHSCLQVP